MNAHFSESETNEKHRAVALSHSSTVKVYFLNSQREAISLFASPFCANRVQYIADRHPKGAYWTTFIVVDVAFRSGQRQRYNERMTTMEEDAQTMRRSCCGHTNIARHFLRFCSKIFIYMPGPHSLWLIHSHLCNMCAFTADSAVCVCVFSVLSTTPEKIKLFACWKVQIATTTQLYPILLFVVVTSLPCGIVSSSAILTHLHTFVHIVYDKKPLLCSEWTLCDYSLPLHINVMLKLKLLLLSPQCSAQCSR